MYSRSRVLRLRTIRKRIYALVRQPIFISVTLVGNGCILLGAALFYIAERGTNPFVKSFLDSLTWTIGTVTTVGHGEISPLTTFGKVISIFVMMGGALFIWSYMALLISALISPELEGVESEIKDLGSGLSQLKREVILDTKSTDQLKKLILEMKTILDQAEGSKDDPSNR